MSATPTPHPEWFGHDKVAVWGPGGLPAAPPAPPGSNARNQGDRALADALSKAGTPGQRPGVRPVARAPKPQMKRRMRMDAESALFTRSMRRLAARDGAPEPRTHVKPLWRSVLGPAYALLPWAVKRRVVRLTSGVRGWHRGP